MKLILFITIIFASLFIGYAQNEKKSLSESKELTRIIKYVVNIEFNPYENPNPLENDNLPHSNLSIIKELTENWYIDKIPFLNKKEFVNNLHREVLSGNVKPFKIKEVTANDVIFEDISLHEILSMGSDTVVLTQSKPYPPFDDTTFVKIEYVNPADICKISFLEKWTYDPKDFSIRKKIIAYAPVRKRRFSYNFQSYAEMYWILCAD